MDNLDEYEKLVQVAIETAFDKENPDTELLLRRLLAMGKIRLVDGQYSRDPLDYEKHFRIDGIEYDREKMFFIKEDSLDEYTKQLEVKVKKLETEVERLTKENKDLSWELDIAQDKLDDIDWGEDWVEKDDE